MSRSVVIALLIIAMVATTITIIVPEFPSEDLRASWLAGVFFESGRLDQIYPADTDAYTMLPPSEWAPYMSAQKQGGNIYPFIYPPLWAAVFAWIGKLADFPTITAIAGFINTLLLGGMILLAWKASASRMSPVGFTAIGLLILIFTTIGGVGLLQNQPQILVGFLMVLAIERTRSGAEIAAGAALALAASIKVYPAAFALLWLASGHRRAFIAFLVSGGILALASVAVAGWPLHQEFLHQLALIKKTIILTKFSYSIDPAIGQLFFADQLRLIPSLSSMTTAGTKEPAGWFILLKHPLWSKASSLLMILVIFVVALTIRHRNIGNIWLLWPLAFMLFALISPISWAYHYLPAVAFAPVLMTRFGTVRGGLLLALLFLPEFILLIDLYKPAGAISNPAQLVGTMAMAGYAFALGMAAGGTKTAPCEDVQPAGGERTY